MSFVNLIERQLQVFGGKPTSYSRVCLQRNSKREISPRVHNCRFLLSGSSLVVAEEQFRIWFALPMTPGPFNRKMWTYIGQCIMNASNGWPRHTMGHGPITSLFSGKLAFPQSKVISFPLRSPKNPHLKDDWMKKVIKWPPHHFCVKCGGCRFWWFPQVIFTIKLFRIRHSN